MISSQLKTTLNSKFANALNEVESANDYNLKAHVNIFDLLKRIQYLSGAILTPEAQQSLEEDPNTFEVLETDIPELKPIVKQMNISLLSSAIAISLQAKQQSADRLFRFEPLFFILPSTEEVFAGWHIKSSQTPPWRAVMLSPSSTGATHTERRLG